MATYELRGGALYYTGTNTPAPGATGTYATPRTIYETRLREAQYRAYAESKVKGFQERFTSEQASREARFKSEIGAEQKKITAKEKAKAQIEAGMDPKLLEQVRKRREAYYNRVQAEKVRRFNAASTALYETGKTETTKEIEGAVGAFTYQEPVGTYTEISTYTGGHQNILGYSTKSVAGVQAEVKTEIEKLQKEYEAKWAATGGTYVNIETGQAFSSILSPTQAGEGFVKIAGPEETNLATLEARKADILRQVEDQKLM